MAKKLYKPILIDSIKAGEDVEQYRFIGFDGNYCKSGAKALGVCDVSTEKDQMTPVCVSGILLVEAAEDILAGEEVTSDSYGKAIVVSRTGNVNGYALDSGSEGDIIRIVRGI